MGPHQKYLAPQQQHDNTHDNSQNARAAPTGAPHDATVGREIGDPRARARAPRSSRAARARLMGVSALRRRPTRLARAERLAGALSLRDAVASRWACRRLLGQGVVPMPALDARAASLPFDMVPGLIALPPARSVATSDEEDAQPMMPSIAALVPALHDVSALRESVPFEQAELLTADGRTVRERRATAWLAEDGIGALAYSGKLMSPSPLSACEVVSQLRDALAADLGERFDCALANLYAEGGTAAWRAMCCSSWGSSSFYAQLRLQ